MAEKQPARPERKKKPAARKGGRSEQSFHDVADPAKKVGELEEELFNIRFQLSTRQLTNTARVRELRRNIARYKTVEHERKLAAAAEAMLAAVKK